MSDYAQEIAAEASRYGGALVRFIRPNDVGATGGHQYGFHLPKSAWPYLTPQAPEKGMNFDHPVQVDWDFGPVTSSKIKWYGTGTRSEYRLTGFNKIRNFQALRHSNIGALLVLIRTSDSRFKGYVVDGEENITWLSAALGIDLVASSWALFRKEATPTETSTTDHALVRALIESAAFPSTAVMAATARQIVEDAEGTSGTRADELLIRFLEVEYEIFRAIEAAVHTAEVEAGFVSIGQFLSLAQTVTQRRKARAGRSLESHVEALLELHGVAFESQPILDGTRPDFVIPSSKAYERSAGGGALVVAVKTTCRDRWRQVTEEGPRASTKYLITTQHGVSAAQLEQMRSAGVQLVVPEGLHDTYPKGQLDAIWSLERFLQFALQLAS